MTGYSIFLIMEKQYNRYPELVGKSTNEKASEYCKAYRRRNPEKAILNAARCRAAKRGIEFSISLEDITIPELCPILQIPIKCHSGQGKQGGKNDSPSLDRIDNTKGYIKGNVQVISNMANSMKFTANPEQLKLFANWINKTYE